MTETVLPVDTSLLAYRPCVGIMLINGGGLVWIGRRCARHVEDPENWQMPQGGIDEGEDPAAAALRELAEETGTARAEIVAEASLWLNYDLPPRLIGVALGGQYRGQRQKWFAMRFTGEDADFNIHNPPGGHKPEFDTWRWARRDELTGLIVPFKRHVYEAVIGEFGHLLD